MRDDGDDHGLHTGEHPVRRGGGAVGHVGPGQGQDDDHRRDDEAHSGDDQAGPPGAPVPHVDGHFGGVGAGDEVGRADQVEELLIGEPLPPSNDLVAHHRDVRSRTAEGGGAQAQEQSGDLAERGVHREERPRIRRPHVPSGWARGNASRKARIASM